MPNEFRDNKGFTHLEPHPVSIEQDLHQEDSLLLPDRRPCDDIVAAADIFKTLNSFWHDKSAEDKLSYSKIKFVKSLDGKKPLAYERWLTLISDRYLLFREYREWGNIPDEPNSVVLQEYKEHLNELIKQLPKDFLTATFSSTWKSDIKHLFQNNRENYYGWACNTERIILTSVEKICEDVISRMCNDSSLPSPDELSKAHEALCNELILEKNEKDIWKDFKEDVERDIWRCYERKYNERIGAEVILSQQFTPTRQHRSFCNELKRNRQTIVEAIEQRQEQMETFEDRFLKSLPRTVIEIDNYTWSQRDEKLLLSLEQIYIHYI